jgi:alpha-mannosidase
VRYIVDEARYKPRHLPKTPFSIGGAPNVILETIKRSDDEKFKGKKEDDSSVIILRLYEAFGGHAVAQLKIAGDVSVSKASLTNLLEDDLETLEVTEPTGDESSSSVTVPFRGFQVVTVKLVVATSSSTASSPTK